MTALEPEAEVMQRHGVRAVVNGKLDNSRVYLTGLHLAFANLFVMTVCSCSGILLVAVVSLTGGHRTWLASPPR